MNDIQYEQISYAKTVYGQEEVDAVVKCLAESTQMGNYSRQFENKIGELFDKKHLALLAALFFALDGSLLVDSRFGSHTSHLSIRPSNKRVYPQGRLGYRIHFHQKELSKGPSGFLP